MCIYIFSSSSVNYFLNGEWFCQWTHSVIKLLISLSFSPLLPPVIILSLAPHPSVSSVVARITGAQTVSTHPSGHIAVGLLGFNGRRRCFLLGQLFLLGFGCFLCPFALILPHFGFGFTVSWLHKQKQTCEFSIDSASQKQRGRPEWAWPYCFLCWGSFFCEARRRLLLFFKHLLHTHTRMVHGHKWINASDW